MKPKLVSKLQDFIDSFETEYGEVELQGYSDIKEFVVKRIVRKEIEIK